MINNKFYEEIREQNLKFYGTKIDVYGPRFISNLYSDRTHFVYELLQNAEDACERLRKKSVNKPFYIEFRLFPDRLEVRHNGIPFDEADVEGICGLTESTKTDDISQIGKFGIGFKSVYAYTRTPEIYSREWHFNIENYVHPYEIQPRSDVSSEETLFVIPFNKEDVLPRDAFNEIRNRLEKLGLRTLLFLKNLSEIRWYAFDENGESLSGKYSRTCKEEKYYKIITLNSYTNGALTNNEQWLVFTKNVDIKPKGLTSIAIGFSMKIDEKKNWDIKPIRNAKVYSYFSTAKESHLKFLIQAPFNTTPSRDNIRVDDEWNKRLIYEISNFLVEECFKSIKKMNLFTVDFLRTLPLIRDDFVEDDIFLPIYEAVKEKLLSDEPYLPTDDGKFTTASKALIATARDLRLLLSSKQLEYLFDGRSRWLDGKITRDVTPDLRRYLMDVLKIPEIDPERFARKITKEFLELQADEWIIKFYAFLLEQQALWRKKELYRKEGILRSKPIIRLENNEHIAPFNREGSLNAYLPHQNKKTNELFNIVKQTIVENQDALKFLRNLGLEAPDKTAGILEKIIPKYKSFNSEIKEKENVMHVKWIIDTLRDVSSIEKKEKLVSKLKYVKFLYAINMKTKEKTYKSPQEIYVGKEYTGCDVVNAYFEGNEHIWLLDERYKEIGDISPLQELGCKFEIDVAVRKQNYAGYVIIEDSYRYHKRGLNGFDPDFFIDELDFALDNITIKRAKIIWDIVKKYCNCISGVEEFSTRQDFYNPEKKSKVSKAGKLLLNNAWLPDKQGKMHIPKDISLTDLHDTFDIDSTEAKICAEKLKMKMEETKIVKELLNKVSPEKKKLFELVTKLTQVVPVDEAEKMINAFIEQKRKASEADSEETSERNILNTIKKGLHSHGDNFTSEDDNNKSDANEAWVSIPPEEEESIISNVGKKMGAQLKKLALKKKLATIVVSEISGGIDPREFLYAQYKGHCQICNTALDLGDNRRPYFVTYRLIEVRNKKIWANKEFNILSLCPNCHALLKHGSHNLENIFTVAQKVLENDIAPEPVEERNGDFYIVKIEVAGKERELYYTQEHMAKIVGFLKAVKEQSSEE